MWNEKESWQLESLGNVYMFVDFIPNEPTAEEETPVTKPSTAELVPGHGNILVFKEQQKLPYAVVGGHDKKYMSMDLRLVFEITKAPQDISLETLAKEVDKELATPEAGKALDELNSNLLSWKLYEDTFADEIECVMTASSDLAGRVGKVYEHVIARDKNIENKNVSKNKENSSKRSPDVVKVFIHPDVIRRIKEDGKTVGISIPGYQAVDGEYYKVDIRFKNKDGIKVDTVKNSPKFGNYRLVKVPKGAVLDIVSDKGNKDTLDVSAFRSFVDNKNRKAVQRETEKKNGIDNGLTN